jgi:tetratricopeptide (TPR) repeat protein
MTVRSIALSISAMLLAMTLLFPGNANAESIKADVNATTTEGYARIVFRFTEETPAETRLSGAVLVLTFQNEVEFSLERLTAARDYISAVRRDPDGKGVRIALARKVRLYSKVVGERLFVDLLPDTWTADAPPLPQEIVDEMIRRARDAERKIKQQQRQQAEQPRQPAAARLRVSRQPTFVRYIFELPDLVAVTPERSKEKLTLKFGAPLKFDLTDALTIRSPAIESVEAEESELATTVTLSLLGNAELRTFREETNFVVDVLSVAPPSAIDKIAPEPRGPAATTRSSQSVTPSEQSRPVSSPTAAPGRSLSASSESPGSAEQTMEARPPAPATPVASRAEPAPISPGEPDAERSPQIATPRSTQPASNTPVANQDVEAWPDPAAGSKAASTDAKSPPADNAVTVTQKRQRDTVSLVFPFAEPVAAAVFTRADNLYVLLDTTTPIELGAIKNDAVREVIVTSERDFQYVRVRLDRPRLVSATLDGSNWTVNIGDTIVSPGQALTMLRSFAGGVKASVLVPLDHAGKVHRFRDPDVGDELVAVTALGPVRGLLRSQEFVDFRALLSVHGIVILPLVDDLGVEINSAGATIARPGGLIITSAGSSAGRNGPLRNTLFDTQQWGFDRQAEFSSRQVHLVNAAAQASEVKRTPARLDLARFYFAREMYVEAKGVLDVVIADDRPTPDDVVALVMRGVANILVNHPDVALKDLNQPIVAAQHDADLWRSLAYARQGKWPQARDGFVKSEAIIARLPIELQREILMASIRASIEVGNFGAAEGPLNDLETLGVPLNAKAAISVLQGRVQEGLGQDADALASYRKAADSFDRAAAAQGRLREVSLRHKLGDYKNAQAIADLEVLTTAWRGDETEAEALQMLSRLYNEEGRYRDAFEVMRVALKAHPTSDLTRRIQDDALRTFDALFLGGKGDALPPIDALSMFYDFKDLTPIGRRGDEMIRRLADRLVSVDLLDQAAELLQHQVDNRLQGAARAQVAARLAVIYLMNRKPDRAIAVLRNTRISELSSEIRNQRLMIEARALADVGRHNLAIEVLESIPGPDALRLRSEILWSAGNYRASAELTELLYGDRWRDWTPYNEAERRELLRAAVGFSLAGDTLGLDRFREKFAPGMLQTPDRQVFQVATAPIDASRDEFKQIVKAIASIDTLEPFIREMRSRQSEAPETTPSASSPLGPQSRALRPDRATTGGIARKRTRM